MSLVYDVLPTTHGRMQGSGRQAVSRCPHPQRCVSAPGHTGQCPTGIVWLDDPDEHDYQAARDFLELIATHPSASMCAYQLESVETTVSRWKAKDLLRAVGPDSNPLSALLPRETPGVARKLRKIHDGEPLSPVLLVRDLQRHTLLIADGDHRVSAAYWTDENSIVPCRITDWE